MKQTGKIFCALGIIVLILLIMIASSNVDISNLSNEGQCMHKVSQNYCKENNMKFKGMHIFINKAYVDCIRIDKDNISYMIEFILEINNCKEQIKCDECCKMKTK